MLRWRGHRLWTSAVLAAGVGLGGCAATERPSYAGAPPDFVALLNLPGAQQPTLVRGQKKAEEPRGLLEMGPARGTCSGRIRATVNGEAILDEEVIAAALQVPARTEKERDEILKAKLDELIERELLMQDALSRLSKKSGARFLEDLKKEANQEFERQWLHRLMRLNKQTDVEAFKASLRESGVPLEQVQRGWVRNFIAMQYLRTRIEPHLSRIGHLQIAAYYQDHPEEFKVDDTVVWQDLFIAAAKHPSRDAARRFAESLIERARSGQDFAKLAKEFDNGDSSLRENAEGIGRKRGEIAPPEAEVVLFGLKEGQVGPAIEIETGYHVVKLVKRTYAGKQPFDDKVQKEIRDKLRNQVFQQEMRRMINDLKQNAIIEVSKENR